MTFEKRWELTVNNPVFTVVMVIYYYVERTWGILVTPNFYNKYYREKHFTDEPVNIHIQSLINIILDNN